MDSFSRQREQRIHPQAFSETNPPSFAGLESNLLGALEHQFIPAESLLDWAHDCGDYSLARLKILSIEHEHRFKQRITRQLNDEIYAAFHVGSWMKQMAVDHTRGFFHAQSRDRVDIETFFFSTGYGMIAWSYCRTSGFTRAIFMGWRRTWKDLADKLFTYMDSVAHPLLLGLVCAQWVIAEAEQSTQRQLAAYDAVEAATGYHSSQYAMIGHLGSGDEQPKDLSELSKKLADASNTMAQEAAYIKIAKKVIQALVDDPWDLRQVETTIWDDLGMVASCILQEINEDEVWDATRFGRVANQMTIIFNLLTREDTAASIKLAEATKRDSSSMKTIAVMTMFFLPATFYATVWAMPGLNTTQAPAFKTYLALSITTTVVIILAWAVITQRQAIRDLLVGMAERRQGAGTGQQQAVPNTSEDNYQATRVWVSKGEPKRRRRH